jgi:hypothetical protein
MGIVPTATIESQLFLPLRPYRCTAAKVARLGAAQDAVNVLRRSPVILQPVGSIRHQAAGIDI